MPHFSYNARSRAGEKTSGVIEAVDRHSALLQVERMGLVPVSVEEQSAKTKSLAGAKSKPLFTMWHGKAERMKMSELLVFTTELSDLLSSGMTLGSALNSLANRRTGRAEDKIVAGLRDDIVRGTSLSDAMANYPATFSGLYISMIKAGEASGALNEVLRRLVTHYEKIQELKEKVIMALVYPLIVVFFGIITLIFSMLFVIPKFKVMFEQMEQALPLPTRILIASSAWIARYGVFVLIAIAVGVIFFNRAVKTNKGRMVWDGLLLRLPLIKGIVASSIYANLARTLGSLLTNGVPVLQALSILEKTVGNAVIGNEIRKAKERVTDGTSISGPLAAGKILPSIMTDMMAIGEQTGDMPGALGHVARRYEDELDRSVKLFTTAIEPILIVVVAVVVGFIAVSILMAVFSMTNGLGV